MDMLYLRADLLNFFSDDQHPLGDFWYTTSIIIIIISVTIIIIIIFFLVFIKIFLNCGILSGRNVGVCSGKVGGLDVRSR